jgi:hypothetical protein
MVHLYHSINAEGFNLGTAASADIGVCATNVPDTSLADIRYLRVSTTGNVTLLGTKTIRLDLCYINISQSI